MSFFADPFTTIINQQALFSPITEQTVNIFSSADGTLAGFRIIDIGTEEVPYFVSQIYDSTTGENILLGATAVQPGWDLTGGLFVTGCIPDRDPLEPDCNFYLVDYV